MLQLVQWLKVTHFVHTFQGTITDTATLIIVVWTCVGWLKKQTTNFVNSELQQVSEKEIQMLHFIHGQNVTLHKVIHLYILLGVQFECNSYNCSLDLRRLVKKATYKFCQQ